MLNHLNPSHPTYDPSKPTMASRGTRAQEYALEPMTTPTRAHGTPPSAPWDPTAGAMWYDDAGVLHKKGGHSVKGTRSSSHAHDNPHPSPWDPTLSTLGPHRRRHVVR